MSGDTMPGSVGDALEATVERIHARFGEVGPTADYEADQFDEVDREGGLEELRRVAWRRVAPPRYRDVELAWFDPNIVAEVEAWARRPCGRNLVLFGPVGTGKTALALAACQSAHFAGLEVVRWPVVELLDALRPGGVELSLDAVAFADRLILDDLGMERPTEWTAERMFAIVNRRWDDKLPTVVTTNLAPDALRDAVGDRMFSRIVGADAVVLRLSGGDRRGR